MITSSNAAAILADGNADHIRIRTLVAQGSPDAYARARSLLSHRIGADMRDAIQDSPERDDDRALAARMLNDMPGPLMRVRLDDAMTNALAKLYRL